MKIAVIGGGITGLTASYTLTKRGHEVTLFERDKDLGGLAYGYREKNWDWSLEYAYHHLFTNDTAILDLMKELGISDNLIMKRPITANYLPNMYARGDKIFEDRFPSLKPSLSMEQKTIASSGSRKFSSTQAYSNIFQLDSPIHLLQFPYLSMIDRLRTGAMAAFCKVYPFWQTLEGITAKEFFTKVGGSASWQVIWEPLMTGKFGTYDETIAASWLWARVNKRTPNLYYIEGGFQSLIERLEETITKSGGTIQKSTSVESVRPQGNSFALSVNGKKEIFDRVLLTVPTPIALKLLPALPESYTKPVLSIPHLHAQTLILETDKPIINNVYWLSITDRSFPFLAAVAHTNFMDKKHYGNHHVTYFGNYLPQGHRYLSMDKEQLLQEFLPFIKRLSPDHQFHIINARMFVGPFAQPVHQLHYSAIAPKLTTPIDGIYLANMDSIYPWDRGTNYAVELGQKAAHSINESVKKTF